MPIFCMTCTRVGWKGIFPTMDTWTLEWDDGASQNSPPLPYEEWRPRPVPLGAARAVVAQFRGFYGVPADPLLVTWDDKRATVRLTTDDLCWYVDETTARFPQHGEIAVQDRWSPYPGGNRYVDAMAVRSLRDLVDTVNADTITSIDLSGTIHILGAHDCVSGAVTRDPESRIILQASGTTGEHSWHLTIIRRLNSVNNRALLGATHIALQEL